MIHYQRKYTILKIIPPYFFNHFVYIILYYILYIINTIDEQFIRIPEMFFQYHLEIKVFRDFGKYIQGFLDFSELPPKKIFWAACGRPSLSNHKITCMISRLPVIQGYFLLAWLSRRPAAGEKKFWGGSLNFCSHILIVFIFVIFA